MGVDHVGVSGSWFHGELILWEDTEWVWSKRHRSSILSPWLFVNKSVLLVSTNMESHRNHCFLYPSNHIHSPTYLPDVNTRLGYLTLHLVSKVSQLRIWNRKRKYKLFSLEYIYHSFLFGESASHCLQYEERFQLVRGVSSKEVDQCIYKPKLISEFQWSDCVK